MTKKGVNFQVYIQKDVKDKAEKIAEKNGFGNLQDLVRFFLNQVANGTFVPKVEIEEVEKKSMPGKSKSESERVILESADFDGDGDEDLIITYKPV